MMRPFLQNHWLTGWMKRSTVNIGAAHRAILGSLFSLSRLCDGLASGELASCLALSSPAVLAVSHPV
jgi:hypothetical protein